jgi:hypothetical protein
MIWKAYIAIRKPGTTDYDCKIKRFELPNTTRADMRAAILHVAKLFKVKEDNVLCLPDCPSTPIA